MPRDRWSRADKIGLLSLLVGIMSGVIGLYQIPAFVTFLHGEPAASFVPPGVAASDSAAAVARMTALRSERRRQDRLLAKEHRHRLHAHVNRIALRNECDTGAGVILHYQALDGKWITEGWADLDPGELLRTKAVTRNPIYYFYAESRLTRWSARGEPGGIDLQVTDHGFIMVDHDTRDLAKVGRLETLSFRQAAVGDEWGWWTHRLTCDT